MPSVSNKCCWKCTSGALLDQIKAQGVVGRCTRCGSTTRKTLTALDLAALLEPVATLYADPADFMFLEALKEGDHPTLAERLVEDWNLFESYDEARDVLSMCVDPYHPKHNPDQSPLEPDREAYQEELWLQGEYELVAHLRERWSALKAEIRHENRHFPKSSIASVADSLWAAEASLSHRTPLYRARQAETVTLRARDMGAPPPEKATAGRANPRAISYLYLASDEVTAASELRPHVGDEIYIARFRLGRDLKLIDFRAPWVGSPFRWGGRLHEVVRIMPFLRQLGSEMSRPVPNLRRELDYIPTQYLCEWIKAQGYGGVAYESGVAAGWNLALFDPSLARPTRPHRRRVTGVTIDIE